MLIERKLKTPGGTAVNLDGKEYEFKPAKHDGPHVCEVKNPTHIKTLLGIDDGAVYVEVTGKTSNLGVVSDIPADLKGKTKKQLAVLTEKELGVKLDTKKAVKTLIAEILKLRSKAADEVAANELAEAEQAEKDAEEAKKAAEKDAE